MNAPQALNGISVVHDQPWGSPLCSVELSEVHDQDRGSPEAFDRYSQGHAQPSGSPVAERHGNNSSNVFAHHTSDLWSPRNGVTQERAHHSSGASS